METITKKDQLISGLLKHTLIISLIISIAYLITRESYLLLGLIFLVALGLSSFHAKPEIIMVYMLAISIPFWKFVLFPLNEIIINIENVYVNLSHILAILLIYVTGIRIIVKLEKIKIGEIGKAILLITLVYIVSIIGVYQAYQNYTEYFKSVINILLFTMLYFAFSNSITKQETIMNIFKLWIIVSLFVTSYSFYQLLGYFITSLPLLPNTEIIQYGGIPRVSSIFKETVPFVQYLVYPIIFMSVMLAEKQPFPFKTLKVNAIVLVILLTSLVLAFSMTGIMYLSIFTFVFILLGKNSFIANFRKILIFGFFGMVLLIIVIYTNYGQMFQSRIFLIKNLYDGSTVARIHTASIAIQEFLIHPIFGIGAGNFTSFTAIGLFPNEVQYNINYCDVLFAQIMAEMGIVGIITILLFYRSMLIALRKVINMNKEKDLNYHISQGLYFMLLTYMISTFIVNGWLEFWVWFNFSLGGTWVILESERLRKIKIV